MLFRSPAIRRGIAAFMSAWMAMIHAPWALAADAGANDNGVADLNAIGKEASRYGLELGSQAGATMPTFQNGQIVIQTGSGSPITIDQNALVPSEGVKYSTTMDDFKHQSEIFKDETAFTEAGKENLDKRYEDAMSDDPSLEGMIYSLMMDQSNGAKWDLTNEDFLNKSEQIFADMDAIVSDLVNCTTTSKLTDKVSTVQMREEKLCQQVLDRTDNCTIQHNYSTSVIEHYAGPYNLDSCGEGCARMWIGKVGDNYWGGSCKIYEEYTQVRVVNPQAITRAVLEYAKWDDYMQVWVGPPGQEQMVWTGPYDFHTTPNYFPPETPGACELSTSWSRSLNVDLTSIFRNQPANTVISFKIRASVTGGGEAYGRIRVDYDPSQAVRNDEWSPANCIQSATGITDGFAKGSIHCTRMPEVVNGCATINGVMVCEDDFKPSPIEGISPFCQQVQVNASFDFYKGDMGCWTALTGYDEKTGEPVYEEVCPGKNEGGNLDTCEKLVEQGCTFVKSECTKDMTGKSGTCYVNDVVYDCGVEKVISTPVEETTTQCEGIACLDEQCLDLERTESTDFAKVNALLNAAQQMAQDMTCTGLDDSGHMTGTENVSCTVFAGNPGWCKKAVGGWVDCCEDAQGGPGLMEFLSLTMQAGRLNTQLTSLNLIYGAEGSWVGDNAPIVADAIGGYVKWRDGAVSAVQNWVGNYSESAASVLDNLKTNADSYQWGSLGGYVDLVSGQIETALSGIFAKIFDKLGLGDGASMVAGSAASHMVVDAVKDQVKDMMASEAKDQAVEQAGANLIAEGMASVLGVVAWVYMIYKITDMVINMVYACEQIEYETMSKVQTKSCHLVGTWCDEKVLGMCTVKKTGYCCYTSPLGRIINEQVHLTQPELFEGGWGGPENPNCEGISIDKINAIDWDRVDLSEWTAMLEYTGLSKEVTELNADTLTGTESYYDYDDTRMNVMDRTEHRLDGVDAHEIRETSARCINFDLGGGMSAGGDCGTQFEPIEGSGAECRFEGQKVDCDEIRVMAALGQLKGEGYTDSAAFGENGYMCYYDGRMVDCSSMQGDEARKKALELYAEELGGSVYQDQYICVDASGAFTSGVCEAAIRQNTCSGLPGTFMCMDGNKQIPCSQLGTFENLDCR